MIDKLDKAIAAMLKSEMPEDLQDSVTISFATPDDQFSPGNAVNLFLYDVRENNELRGNEWVTRDSETGNRDYSLPPIKRIDCSYLVTAWSTADKRDQAKEEHHILGEVMKILLRCTHIPDGHLDDELKNTDLPPPATALQPGRLQSMGEFWQALGGKPKAAFDLTVTISVQPQTKTEQKPHPEKMILDMNFYDKGNDEEPSETVKKDQKNKDKYPKMEIREFQYKRKGQSENKK